MSKLINLLLIKKYLADEEFWWLFLPAKHMPLLATRRAEMILFRVRMVAILFAILTAAWVVVDIVVLPWPIWGELAAGRLLSSAAFVWLASMCQGSTRMRDTYAALGALYAIPTLFYIFSYALMQQVPSGALSETIAGIYAFLPIIMVAGLGMFPLTALEGLIFASPVLLAELISCTMDFQLLSLSHLISTAWLSAIIAMVATLGSMSQLGFMIALVRQVVRDPLTRCFSRQSGEELLEIQFIIASRSNAPLTVGFVDLDNFKSINDTYGHETGDQVLQQASNKIRDALRTGDMLARWGGEEFILILPSTYCDEAKKVMEKVQVAGLGFRPDGAPITASIGLAERTLDSAEEWRRLIEVADKRMYTAKQTGKNKVVGCDEAFASTT